MVATLRSHTMFRVDQDLVFHSMVGKGVVMTPGLPKGTIIIHEHTRVGPGFHCTVLVTAPCPALKTGIVIVQSVPSALASNVPGLKCSA